jgi:alkyldihydroxyacetonephosphate synthase
MLASELELPSLDADHRPVSLEQVQLPEVRLADLVLEKLTAVVGEEHVRQDRLARVAHAVGRSYPDLLRLRSGDASSAPDAVAYPGSHDEVRALLDVCSAARVAVVPFGGGSSVVGGVEPVRDGFEATLTLDLARMDRVLAVDRDSLTATLEPGLTGPAAEHALGASGLTLGHFPQSWEYATIGGFVATRSAGQASTGFGRIDELVLGLRCACPSGEVVVHALPASAAPDSAIRELIVGSEGVLGVITEVTLAVRTAPSHSRYEGWMFGSWEEGCEAFRLLEQSGAAPDVARLSDPDETRLSMAFAATGSVTERAARAYLRLRSVERGCLAITGFEGERTAVERRAGESGDLLRKSGAVALGRRPGRVWLRNRFAGPYLRDTLLDHGVLVETLETATTWSNLQRLYTAVGDALRSTLESRGTRLLVMCHVSHLYRSGASLYYTFLARSEHGSELEQWRAAKSAASDAIVAAGGTITHHHAIGRDHAPWLRAEIGEKGIELLRAAKETLDPHGIMNPGKLLPDD